MNEVVRNDILAILADVADALKDPLLKTEILFNCSNRCIHNASIFQDQDSVRLAVVVYALYKIKKKYSVIPEEADVYLAKAVEYLRNYNVEQYRRNIQLAIEQISKISHFRTYVERVLDDAKIKKGAKLIDHGISVAQASEVLGVSQWEMQNYLGKSDISDDLDDDNKTRLVKRIVFARSLFGLN
ncbi:hypothetical protein JXM83_05915 [Candidatus Woesearchaeota archaeon]|nr:hypothetical protein [Candidatus Woesearchaeota archaeon]